MNSTALTVTTKKDLRTKITFDKKTKKPRGVLQSFPMFKFPEKPVIYNLNHAIGIGRELFPKQPGFTLWDACFFFLSDEQEPFRNLRMMNLRCASRFIKYPDLFPKNWNNWVYFLDERLLTNTCSFAILRMRIDPKVVALENGERKLEYQTIPMNTVFSKDDIIACFDLKNGRL